MPNRLANASSPYLLQHADNPVDWYEWGDDALSLARERDIPILLSIGYAACHWCHVMAHESFEDDATAALMNRLFVNIKVDREQRPDLDRIYQLAHQVIQRRGGGWPLTAFLDPHTHQPFFIGTYFPREPRHGMPPFRQVLERVAVWYRDEPAARAQNNAALAEFFGRNGGSDAPRHELSDGRTTETMALAALERDFDPEHGGFSPAPKFPHATQLQWLLRRADPRARRMAHYTLDRMCRGGLFDQLGGGFCRYSVDERWEIPHFEKMLYDNGLLLASLAEAEADPVFARAARLTAGWVMREMQHADGGYFASLDADSEGHEGRYYVWDAGAVRAALSAEEWAMFAPLFGLDQPPNFEGRWHLHNASDADLSQPAVRSASQKLLELRARRIRPATDDKVLAAWNGLMIRGMTLAGRAFDEPAWIESASRAARFVHRELWQSGRLCTSWREGRVIELSFLDDYAYLLDGLVELLQDAFDAELLEFAVALADGLLARFADAKRGGFYFTPNDHEQLIQRPKGFSDDATPNGNGVAAYALGRLGHLLGETRYLGAASATVASAVAYFGDWPHAHAAALLALDEQINPPTLEIYRGTPLQLRESEPGMKHGPHTMAFKIPTDAPGLLGQLADQPALEGTLTLYRCVGTHCESPQRLG
ncbi:MAG: thioredoxin domain-containing protein [Gammaproteobacteria bacterium]